MRTESVGESISTSSENYLETVYELSLEGQPVRSVEVAKRMDVSKASVNKAVGVLRQAGMVEQEHYGAITLTQEGMRRAEELTYRHQTIKRFLIEMLGVDESIADQDACRMEHIISEQTMRSWASYIERLLEEKGS